MIVLAWLFALLLALALFDVTAAYFGVDSRDAISDDHRS